MVAASNHGVWVDLHPMDDLTRSAAGIAMWDLVEAYRHRVGYRRGVKAEGLRADPPVIDCSGWVGLLLTTGLRAACAASGDAPFDPTQIDTLLTWSDRMIAVIEERTGLIRDGDRLIAEELPRYATIGLRQGGGAWARNQPRPRGITQRDHPCRSDREAAVR